MITKKILNRSSYKLLIKQKYNYLSIIDKPLHQLSLISFTQATSQLLQFGYNDLALCPQLSCIVGGLIFRLGIHIFSSSFENMKLRKPQKSFLQRWLNKIFITDMKRDCEFYKLSQSQYQIYEKKYMLGYIVKNCVNTYMLMNFFRGCYSTLYHTPTNGFLTDTMFVSCINFYDPTFTTPIIIILLNYLLLRYSRHPFLIHLTQSHNRIYLLNFAFMTGLLFVPLPAIYTFSYIGIVLGHFCIRGSNNFRQDLKNVMKSIKTKLF